MKNLLLKSSFIIIGVLFIPLFSYNIFVLFNDFSEERNKIINRIYFDDDLPSKKYNEREKNHLNDIKNLIKKINIVFLLFVVYLITVGIFLKKKTLQLFSKIGIISLLTYSLFFILVLFFFEQIFYFFHLVSFEESTRIFSENSTIYQTFPPEFFEQNLLKVLIIIFSVSFVLYLTKNLTKN